MTQVSQCKLDGRALSVCQRQMWALWEESHYEDKTIQHAGVVNGLAHRTVTQGHTH